MSFVMKSHSRTKTIIKLSIPIIIIFTILANNVKTDLPVHCKREKIEGEWVFRINNDSFDPSLADFRSTCGHGFPDKIEKLESDINYAFDDFWDLRIFLGKDYKIYDPDSNEIRGKWTPIYDEGFIVYYNNFVFTAFMKYHLKPDIKHKIKKNEKVENNNYMSNCKKTMIGWFIKDERENAKNWSCFFGFKKSIESEFNSLSQSNNKGFFNLNSKNNNCLPKKVLKPNKNFSAFNYFYFNKKTRKYDKQNDDNDDSNYDLEDSYKNKHIENKVVHKANDNDFLNHNSNGFVNLNLDLLDSVDSLDNNSFLEMKTQTESSSKMKLRFEQVKYEEQIELINEINSNNLTWRAQMYDDFKGLSFMDLKMKLGLRDSKKEKSFFEQNKDSSNKAATSEKAINEERLKETSEKFSKDPIKKKNLLKNQKNLVQDFNKPKSSSYIESNTSFSTEKVSKELPLVLLSLGAQESGTPEEAIFASLNKSLENPQDNSLLRDKDGEKTFSFEEVSKYINKELDEIDEKTLPKNWDWRNIGGISYIPEPRKQGNCGSCYVFSMITSLESRLRIMTNNNDKTTFSRQFPISCNFYTEGCEGGYPILVAKFSSEFELIPESCFEYKPETSKCSDVCDYKKFQKKYFVSKFEYLGGFYGNTNEIQIMKELRARGPIPGNMTVPWSFSYYKSGIYSQNEIKKNAGNLSKTTMLDKHLSWTSVDHSILLIGYGEENGTKYWIGMNTWGRNWGENGFFRILRGENDCNIETMGDAARIAFKYR